MTLIDFRGHSYKRFHLGFSYTCETVDQISADIEHRTVLVHLLWNGNFYCMFNCLFETTVAATDAIGWRRQLRRVHMQLQWMERNNSA